MFSTPISGNRVDTAAEIPLSTALQAAELFVNHSRELAPLSIIPIEPTISDLLEQECMLATPGHVEFDDSWYGASNFCCFEESGTMPCNARPKREGHPRIAAVGLMAGG
jgi:hypothetical protein